MRTRTVVALVLLLTLGLGSLMAEPESKEKCCTPQPVGGIEALKENTVYPLTAERSRQEADVVVNFQVDENGMVSNISVLRSAGRLFDASAMNAVANTDWRPAMQNGKPVSVVYSQDFKYRIQ